MQVFNPLLGLRLVMMHVHLPAIADADDVEVVSRMAEHEGARGTDHFGDQVVFAWLNRLSG